MWETDPVHSNDSEDNVISLILQAAAEYMGTLLGGLVRNAERGVQDAWRWLGDNPVAIVIILVLLILLRRARVRR